MTSESLAEFITFLEEAKRNHKVVAGTPEQIREWFGPNKLIYYPPNTPEKEDTQKDAYKAPLEE